MFNPIRELIAQNKIAQALASCGELNLSPTNRSRLISLRRRWDLLTEQAIAQAREERLLRLEENGLVEDLLKWLDHMEYTPEASEEWSVKVTHTKQGTGTGAAAGTGNGSVKSKVKWLWIGAAVIVLLAVTWMLWPPTSPTGEAATEAREVRETPPADGNNTESPTSPATEEPPVTKPTNPGRTKVNPGDLVAVDPSKIDLSKIDPSRVQLDPNLRLNPDALRKLAAANALMTTGDQVDVAVAFYRNAQAPTKYDAVLSKALASYLGREAGGLDIAPDVLTQKFHDHEKRDRLQMRGVFDATGLSAGRARFLFLCDVRNIDARGKAELRMCLYDVERGKGFTRGKGIDVGTSARTNAATGSRLQEKELFYAARDYLKEMKERGILK
jgi:hypothetical protein